MKLSLPTRQLRDNPDLDQLKRQAKELLDAYLAGDHAAVAEVNAHYRAADPTHFALHDAQLVLARAYGFESWPKLKARVDGVTVSRLCEAVERGDLATARDLLQRRPEIVDLEWPGHAEMGALHTAVLRRDAPMAQLLMDHGADARRGIWPNRDATSPRTIAIERGYDDIAAIIQAAEAQRGARGPQGPSDAHRALGEAAMRGDAQAVIAVLDAHPELMDICPPNGFTMLHQAAGMLAEPVIEWLLRHGADPNARTKGGWTPMEFAASANNWPEGATPDQFAAVARLLLRHGAETGPLTAIALGDAAWIRARHAEGALDTAASLNVFGPCRGLLTAAVRNNRPEMLALLLDLGLDPDERARVEGTDDVEYSWGMPLRTCAGAGRLEMARMLLERGANPNTLVYAASSALFDAHQAADGAMIDLIEKHGGVLDADALGYLRQTELARKMLAGEVVPRLAPNPGSGDTLPEQLLWSGASGGDPEIVRMALERIDWPRDDPRWFWMLWRPMPGFQPWPEADRPLFLECFRLILERCDPNQRAERFGQTMLHECVSRDYGSGVAMATMLLDAGARLDIRDDLLQSTPLGWACRWGRIEMVKLFLARGADPVEADAEPWATPRAWAEKKGRTEILALLR